MIRAIRHQNIEAVKAIHEKYYREEFKLPDFVTNYLCAFTAVDDNDGVIAVGGVRTIAEAVLLTNKDYSVRERRSALYEILQASQFIAGRSGYNELSAFVKDEQWAKHLERVGFRPIIGSGLVIDVVK